MRESASYCRIRTAKDEAVRRFAAWNGLPRVGPLAPLTVDDPAQIAKNRCRLGWREVVFVSEVNGWTLFNDLTGAFTLLPTAAWLALAGADDLLFAAYNSGLEYGELLAVRHGVVVREFRASADSPGETVDVGALASPHEPFRGWVEVACFVAGDELGFSTTGWVWFYDRGAAQSAAAERPSD